MIFWKELKDMIASIELLIHSNDTTLYENKWKRKENSYSLHSGKALEAHPKFYDNRSLSFSEEDIRMQGCCETKCEVFKQ